MQILFLVGLFYCAIFLNFVPKATFKLVTKGMGLVFKFPVVQLLLPYIVCYNHSARNSTS